MNANPVRALPLLLLPLLALVPLTALTVMPPAPPVPPAPSVVPSPAPLTIPAVTVPDAAQGKDPNPQSPREGDWPLFRGHALQTGVTAARLPDRLEVLWKFETK